MYRANDQGSMAQRNNKQGQFYNPPGVTALRHQLDNYPLQTYPGNIQSYQRPRGNVEDEVIYAKPSFENSSIHGRKSTGTTRPTVSPPSATSSLKRNENWNVEADQSTTGNMKSNSMRPSGRDYLTKANAVYQNETPGYPNTRYEFQSPTLSRQSSAFSSYSRQKDTVV